MEWFYILFFFLPITNRQYNFLKLLLITDKNKKI